MAEAPLLASATREGMSRRINKLVEKGILTKFIDNDDNSKTYFAAGPAFKSMIYDETNSVNKDAEIDEGVIETGGGVIQESLPRDSKVTTP
jgi:hypothetical protein